MIIGSKTRHAFGLAALLLLGACDLLTGPDRPKVALSLPSTAFVRGDALPLSIENRSGRSLYGSPICNQGIERLADGVWTPAYSTSCLGFLRVEEVGESARLSYAPTEIPAGETVVLTWSVPMDAGLGPHRIRLRLTSGEMGDGKAYEYVSPQFTVGDGALLRR